MQGFCLYQRNKYPLRGRSAAARSPRIRETSSPLLTEGNRKAMKKQYQTPAIEYLRSVLPDFLASSQLPVEDDSDTQYGEINFF